MAVDSPQPPLYFVILSCVFLSAHFNKDGNEIFDDTHTSFIIFFENMFIINENNDATCNFENDPKEIFDDKHMGLRILI